MKRAVRSEKTFFDQCFFEEDPTFFERATVLVRVSRCTVNCTTHVACTCKTVRAHLTVKVQFYYAPGVIMINATGTRDHSSCALALCALVFAHRYQLIPVLCSARGNTLPTCMHLPTMSLCPVALRTPHYSSHPCETGRAISPSQRQTT
jgi:hypothetical protein